MGTIFNVNNRIRKFNDKTCKRLAKNPDVVADIIMHFAEKQGLEEGQMDEFWQIVRPLLHLDEVERLLKLIEASPRRKEVESMFESAIDQAARIAREQALLEGKVEGKTIATLNMLKEMVIEFNVSKPDLKSKYPEYAEYIDSL